MGGDAGFNIILVIQTVSRPATHPQWLILCHVFLYTFLTAAYVGQTQSNYGKKREEVKKMFITNSCFLWKAWWQRLCKALFLYPLFSLSSTRDIFSDFFIHLYFSTSAHFTLKPVTYLTVTAGKVTWCNIHHKASIWPRPQVPTAVRRQWTW